MKVIIYRNKSDKSINRLESCQKYLDRGMTMEKIESAVSTYKCDNLTVELHDVSDNDAELVSLMLTDTYMLLKPTIVHDCGEEIPNNTYIYVWRKHKGHSYPTMEIMKVMGAGVRLPELRGDTALPIAWCRASDLLGHLGFNRYSIEKMERTSRGIGCGYFKE